MMFDQLKRNTSSTTIASLTQLDVHHIIIVIYIKVKLHEIPFSGYLVIAPDGHGQNYILPPRRLITKYGLECE